MYAQTHKIQGRPTETRVFDSAASLVEHALEASPEGARCRQQLDGGAGFDSYLGESKFIGRRFRSLKETEVAALGRWEEGIALVESMAEELRQALKVAPPKSRRRRTQFSDVDGVELDLDRLRSGQDFWRTTRREVTSSPANLTLSVDVAANGNRAPEEIIWRGVAAIVLTEMLEQAGYRVELWAHEAGFDAYTDGTDEMIAVCLKSLSDVLDRSTLVNAVSGWFFRTVFFSEITRSHEGRSVQVGLGKHRIPSREELAAITHDPDTIVVQNVWTRHDAALLVRGILARFA